MRKLLITGFDPFGKYSMNPSWEVIKALPDKIGDFALTKLMLLNIYGSEFKKIAEAAQKLQPDCILMLGMNSGSTSIILDTVAINLRDALIEDNLGKKPWNEPIVENAPAAYFASLDVHALVKKLRKQKLPVEIGYCGGAYICNEIFYLALHHYGDSIPIGFIHVPLMPEMVWDENMARPLEETAEIVEKIIEEIAKDSELLF